MQNQHNIENCWKRIGVWGQEERFHCPVLKEMIHCRNCNVFIQIEDRGIGIPSKHVNKIFKEFYRIDDTLTSKVKGTGLGLTIAQKIINDHNGNIIYKPRTGGGSVFQIILPVN